MRASVGAACALLIAGLPAPPASAQSGSADGSTAGASTPDRVPDAVVEAGAQASAARETAVVVLVGEARASSELVFVLSELLLQQNVQPQFVPAERFSPRALLDADASDGRVWVFIALDGPARARLYFRGPHGQRFMLRELVLRAGLDEVGRELIARVVEGATAALLHSQEGLSRAQAEADLARSEEPASEPAAGTAVSATAVPVDREPAAAAAPARRWLLAVRVLGQHTGADLGARLAIGFEAGWLARARGFPRVRVRLASESGLAQTIENDAVRASLTIWPLRAGADLGAVGGAHGLWLGASAGVDLLSIKPSRVSDPSLTLGKPGTGLVAAARYELRYELTVDQLLLSLAAVLDHAFARSHYDVIADGERMRVATPWQARPGALLGAGMTF